MANVNNYNSSDLVSGVDNVSGKSGKKIAGITTGVLAVVAGGSAAAYGCSDYVRNQVNLRVMKPQSYYAWVNTNNVKESAKGAGDSYREFIKAIENGSSSNVDMKFELSDAAKDIIIDEALGGENEYTKNYVDIIRNIDTLSLNCKSDVKKGLSSATASLDLNGSRLATFDFASDSANADSFFRLEELTSKWAVFTLPEGEDSEEQEKIMNAYKEFLRDPESVLSADEFEDVVERYTTIWNRNVGDVTVEKKESVEIGDISVDYTVMTINMTDELAQDIAKDVINEAKNDAVIKKIVVDKLGICSDEEYTEKLDETLESIQDKDEDSDGSYTIRTYVDPKGVIRGTEVTDDNDEDNKAGFVIGKDGDVVRGKAFITGTDDDLSAVLSATDNGGKYTGNISITADGEDVSVEFKDFEVVNKEKCFCNGDVTVTADEKPVSITLRATNDSQTVSTDINVNGTEYGKFTMDISTDKSGSPEIPDKSSAFVIDLNDDDLGFKEYVSQDETEKFLEGLFKGIGFNDDEAKSSAQSISSLFYFDYSSMYSDFDSDDYDFGDGEYEFNFDDSDVDFDFDSADFDSSDLSLT